MGRVSLAASGIPVGVYTVRASRRGHDADVTLARGSQYSTQPASACHTCHPQGKKSPPWIGPRLPTGLFLLDQEPTLGGGVAGVHGRPRS